jgi:hypothetical protein
MAPSCLSRDPILPSLRGMSLYTELLKCICLYICSKKIHMACCHLEDYFVVTCSNLLSLSLFLGYDKARKNHTRQDAKNTTRPVIYAASEDQ